MSQFDYEAILDHCLARMRQGESPQACLANYPSQAGELAPDLALSGQLFQLPLLEPAPKAVAIGFEKMMAALDAREKTAPLAGLSALVAAVSGLVRRRGFPASALRVALVSTVLLVAVGAFAITAAADTLPGDALYPVKRTWEDARLMLTADDSSRAALRSSFEKRRREEVQAVQELRRPVTVEFNGLVESAAGDVWQVGGLALTITNDTEVGAGVSLGQEVTVRAQVKDDGSLSALALAVDPTTPLPPMDATATPTKRPTRPPRPVDSTLSTRDVAAPSPTPALQETRPAPTPTPGSDIRPAPEPTVTPAPSVNDQPTREPQPTKTPASDSLATAAPLPTATPAKSDATRTPTATPGTVDVAPPTPTPTPTSRTSRDLYASPTPTATRSVNAGK
jgi:hypothetical protein